MLFLFLFKIIFSSVLVENGTLTLSFNDISVHNNLTIKRTYNSINFVETTLGNRWSTSFDLKLKSVLGVLIQIEDSGSNYFYIKAQSDALNQVITQIVKTQTDNVKIVENLKKILLENSLMLSYFISVKNLFARPSKGDIFYAVDGTIDKVVFDGSFFIREKINGQKEYYNSKGLLIRIEFEDQTFLRFSYDKNILKRISDNSGRILDFIYDDNKLLNKIKSKVEEVFYYYNKDKSLIKSIDTKGNVYTYEYDLYKNLTKIFLNNKLIKEYAFDKDNRVALYKDDLGCSTTYTYSSDTSDRYLYYMTRVKKICNDKLAFLKTYEFWYKYKEAGGIYLEKYTLKEGKNYYTIIYKDFGKKPALIDTNGKVSTYFYDNLQRVYKKVFNDKTSLNLVYKEDTNKVIKVNIGDLNYYYAYDSLDRINKIIFDDNSIVVDFDKKNRARLIKDEKNGVFLISYDNYDRIIKLSSKEGDLELKYSKDGSLLLNSFSTKINIDKFRNVYKAYLDALEVFKKLEVAYL